MGKIIYGQVNDLKDMKQKVEILLKYLRTSKSSFRYETSIIVIRYILSSSCHVIS